MWVTGESPVTHLPGISEAALGLSWGVPCHFTENARSSGRGHAHQARLAAVQRTLVSSLDAGGAPVRLRSGLPRAHAAPTATLGRLRLHTRS